MARFRVAPERIPEVREKRKVALEALRGEFPGLVSEQLVRLDEQTWMDLIVWDTRETADTVAERAPQIPEAAAYFAALDEVVSMEHAEIVHSG